MGDADLNAESWARISRLLDEVLELPEASRAAWLDALAPLDASYRKAIERLLKAHADAQRARFLDTLPKIDPDLLGDAPRPGDPVDFREGMEIGPYRLERRIGGGGMGTVWLAQRTDGSLKRRVALKLLRPGPWNRLLLERFDRERDILAGLTHPHIARLYDAGVTRDGQPYLALEYVEGQPITDDCDTRRLDVRHRIQLFLQVLDAVQHAHRNLVIHRDLKPSNILVTADGSAMLLDFGIAKLLGAEGEEAPSTELTELGGRALTPEFASPEQIAGSSLTTATDIYSLGVLLCALLSGHRPYRLVRGSRAELEEAILTGEPAAPSRLAGTEDAERRGTTPARLAQTLAGDLDTIVLKTLKKDPTERYASADALAGDLGRYLKGEPVEARPESRLYRVSKFVSRHRAGVGTAAAVMAAILGSLAFALVQMRAATRQRDAALFEARLAAASQELAGSLVGEARVRPGDVGIEERLEKSRALIQRQFAADPVIRAELLFEIAEKYDEMRNLVKKQEVMNEIAGLARDSGLPSLRARQLCGEAGIRINEAEPEAALALLRDGFAELRKEQEPPLRATLECVIIDSYHASVTGDFRRAVEQGSLAVKLQEDRGLANTQGYADALDALSTAYSFLGDVRGALDAVRKERESYVRFGRDDTLAYVKTLFREATYLNRGGRRAEALKMSDDVLKESHARGLPDNQSQLSARGAILLGMGRPEEALALFESAAREFARQEVRLDGIQMDILGADALLRMGKVEAAGQRIMRSWPEIEEQLEAKNSAITKGLRVRAEWELAAGRLPEAWTSIQRALGIIAGSGSPTYTGAVRVFMAAAQVALARGEPAAALDLIDRAGERARRDAVDPAQSADIGETLLVRARILAALGRSEEARRDTETARGHLEGTVPATHPLAHQAQELARLLSRPGL